jgi:hypothetical protein
MRYGDEAKETVLEIAEPVWKEGKGRRSLIIGLHWR